MRINNPCKHANYELLVKYSLSFHDILLSEQYKINYVLYRINIYNFYLMATNLHASLELSLHNYLLL